MTKTTQPETVQTAGCPACSEKRAFAVKGQIYRCAQCDGIYGTCYLGESYAMVQPAFAAGDVPVERQRYYDFTCLGSNGITRRHGWYDTETRLITQVG